MSIIAEFTVESPELVLYDATKSCPQVTTELITQVGVDGQQLMFLWANGEDLDAFEAAIEGDETVDSFERYTDLGDRRFYRIHISDESGRVSYPAWVRLGATRLETLGGDGESWNRFRFPDREAFRTFREWCEQRDIEFTLHSLRRETMKPNDRRTRPLTPDQAEVLNVAYERGYFEVPQKTTLAELGQALDISQQAVSERLHRAFEALVEAYVRDIE